MKVRLRAEVIEATQWFKQGDHPAVRPIPEKFSTFVPVEEGAEGFIGDSLEGFFVHPGDWIIPGAEGKFYPCTPEKFEQLYEKL